MTLEHPFADLVGFSVSERTEKQCVTELTLEKKHLNPNGVVQAACSTPSPTRAWGALMETLPAGHYCATIEIKIAYFRPAKEGTVRCVTELVHLAPHREPRKPPGAGGQNPRPNLRNLHDSEPRRLTRTRFKQTKKAPQSGALKPAARWG